MQISRQPLEESVTLRFPVAMTDRIDVKAEQLGRTRSSLIRLAVREFLKDDAR
jgi:predicted DNA-binding protein